MSLPPGEVERVASVLQERIVANVYSSGLRLPPELTLAEELGCSRSTLREALRHLSGLGLVTSRRGSGVMVRDFRREGGLGLLPVYLAAGRFDLPLSSLVRELLHVRKLLASEAARLAATYAPAGSLGPARKLAAKLRTLEGDPVAFTLGEVDLFREILSASRVWPVVWFANAFWVPLRAMHGQFAGAFWYLPPRHGAMVDALLTAIEAHDGQRASELVRAHFDEVDAVILPRVDEALEGQKPAA
jgi:DNA-binding FadR family transcriptional regulator